MKIESLSHFRSTAKEEILIELETGTNGISDSQSQKKLNYAGQNRIKAKKKSDSSYSFFTIQ
jgi:hypothetical protein